MHHTLRSLLVATALPALALAQSASDQRLIAELKARTDIAVQIQPLVKWTGEHEHRDQEEQMAVDGQRCSFHLRRIWPSATIAMKIRTARTMRVPTITRMAD